MLNDFAENAIIPMTRAIFARRISKNEYTQLMRRRSVPEVAQVIKAHPYFEGSFQSLSDSVPHRGHLESLLNADIYYKYEKIMRFCFNKKGVSQIFLYDCEVTELLAKFTAMAQQGEDEYILHMPEFLRGNLCFDLLKLAKAKTFDECLAVLARTPYAEVIKKSKNEKDDGFNFLKVEQALKSFYFTRSKDLADKTLTGQSRTEMKNLIAIHAEIYNLELIFRLKTYFKDTKTNHNIKDFIVPVYYKINKKNLLQLCDSIDSKQFIAQLDKLNVKKLYGDISPEDGLVNALDAVYATARKILHFTTDPEVAMCAGLVLANIEKNNVITVIEGVRYGLAPEEMDKLIKY